MATSKRSKSSTAKSRSTPLDPARPFSPAIWKRATQIARQYQVIVRYDDEEGEYFGRGLELPNIMGDGSTPGECVKATINALIAVVATHLERGEPVPRPAAVGAKTEQVNFRVTIEEKQLLEHEAREGGFRSVGDYVRATVISH